jgi:hypothetical protein
VFFLGAEIFFPGIFIRGFEHRLAKRPKNAHKKTSKKSRIEGRKKGGQLFVDG